MLILTYNNKIKQDGYGAQLCRILSIYTICKHLNIPYYHSDFDDIKYQGLNNLIEDTLDVNFAKECNDRLLLKSDIDIKSIENLIILEGDLDVEKFKELSEKAKTENILYKTLFSNDLINNYRNMYIHCNGLYKIMLKKNNVFTIGIHVRRGDILFVESFRLLPNSYYIHLANEIIEILTKYNIPYIIELYTENPEKKSIITAKHQGISKKLRKGIIVDPEQNNIEEFDVLPNLTKYINEDVLLTFDRMLNADILIASKSNLSRAASYLKKGITIYQPFYHKHIMLTRDIRVTDSNYKERINEFVKNYRL